MKIAVSGEKGSFSHQAAQLYATAHSLSDIDIIFCGDSAGAFSALSNKEADKIIIPIYNSTGGFVNMTLQAMGEFLFQIEEMFEMNVLQCLLIDKNINADQIEQIASHPQALKQCKDYLQENWSGRELLEYQDTAKAAKDLASGKLDNTTAVIAPELAAEIYGLKVLEESIQDLKFNATTFLVVASPGGEKQSEEIKQEKLKEELE